MSPLSCKRLRGRVYELSLFFEHSRYWIGRYSIIDFWIELNWIELQVNEKIISKLFGESGNYGFWSKNGAGTILEYRAVRGSLTQGTGVYSVSGYPERKVSRRQILRAFGPHPYPHLNSFGYILWDLEKHKTILSPWHDPVWVIARTLAAK